jgi:hypothetical protein
MFALLAARAILSTPFSPFGFKMSNFGTYQQYFFPSAFLLSPFTIQNKPNYKRIH